jgi:hypothetical protein
MFMAFASFSLISTRRLRCFFTFLSSSRQMLGQYIETGCSHSVPHHFKIVSCIPYIIRQYIASALERASLNSPKDNLISKKLLAKGVPWLRRLFADPSPQRPRFAPRSVHVGFVEDKVSLNSVFSEFFSFNLPKSFHYGSPYSCITLEMLVAAVQKHRLTPST